MLGLPRHEDRVERCHNDDTIFFLDIRYYLLEHWRREYAPARRAGNGKTTVSIVRAQTFLSSAYDLVSWSHRHSQAKLPEVDEYTPSVEPPRPRI